MASSGGRLDLTCLLLTRVKFFGKNRTPAANTLLSLLTQSRLLCAEL
jgi:hypothetical protein